MAPLLSDRRLRRYDILAIQEQYRNRSAPTTYRGNNTGFKLAHGPVSGRACFFVNEHLAQDSWSVEFISPDYCILTLQMEGQKWNIHNVYSEPPAHRNDTQHNSPIPLLHEKLQGEGEHLLVGDFNLYHPLWSGIRGPECHAAAAGLLRATRGAGMELLTPPGIITWSREQQKSTIDLTFATQTIT